MNIRFEETSPSNGQVERLTQIANDFDRLFSYTLNEAVIDARDNSETITFYRYGTKLFTISASGNRVDGPWLDMTRFQ